MPHLIWTLLLAILISTATALPGDRATRERVCAAVYTFASCTVVVFAGSWLMHWIHG
jgi:uncharacterized membrane protein